LNGQVRVRRANNLKSCRWIRHMRYPFIHARVAPEIFLVGRQENAQGADWERGFPHTFPQVHVAAVPASAAIRTGACGRGRRSARAGDLSQAVSRVASQARMPGRCS
jgi:hypothetical protein